MAKVPIADLAYDSAPYRSGPDVVFDDGLLAFEPVLFPQPLKDALHDVALLLGNPPIRLQDGVSYTGVRIASNRMLANGALHVMTLLGEPRRVSIQ